MHAPRRDTNAKLGRCALAALLAAFALASIAPAQASQDNPTAAKSTDLSGLHAFDLRVGKWKIRNRVLKERLAGSKDWLEYDGTQTWWSLMKGRGNIDDTFLDKPGGAYSGATLRAYDPKTGQWAIWWLDGRTPSANLDPPVVGRFVNGVGAFYSNDTLRGKPIRVRFIWSKITKTSAHWEQAFSADGGKTWETNWTSEFTRAN